MKSKRDKTRDFIISGDYKKAIKNAKGFDRIYNKDEIRVLQIASECLSGNTSFYLSLGYNIDNIVSEAKELLNKMINK